MKIPAPYCNIPALKMPGRTLAGYWTVMQEMNHGGFVLMALPKSK